MPPRLLPAALLLLLAGGAPPAREPSDFDPAGVPRTDRLAPWVPADAAAVFFESIASAETEIAAVAAALPDALPGLVEEAPAGRGALDRGTEMLLLLDSTCQDAFGAVPAGA